MCNYSDYVLNKGIKQGEKQGAQKTAISDIRSLMETMALSPKQAMDALKIPTDDQAKYAEILSV